MTSRHRSTPKQNINSKIFTVCLILNIRESGLPHIMALLFLNGVFTGTAGGVMSICIFHVETDEISPHTLIACRVLNYLPPYCVSCVAKRIFFNNNNKKNLHCQHVI